jgi:L-threonylcarbamoyladenylate synthase
MQITSQCTKEVIMQAARALSHGNLVAFPTETVYGLGADATNESAVSRIYSVKGRPTGHPLIVHISSLSQIKNWAINIPDYVEQLAREYWPGPLTVVLKRSSTAKDFITGQQDSIALRIPNDPIALDLLVEFEKLGGLGIAAPSANRYQSISPTSADDVITELGEFLKSSDLVLDGGSCKIGIESTIVNCLGKNPEILRPGAILEQDIINLTALTDLVKPVKSNIKTSGTLGLHYSPKAKVILNETPLCGDGLLALKDVSTPDGVVRLGSPQDIHDFARTLYQSLRLADKLKLKKVVVQTPDSSGLGLAINNRLEKMLQI